MENVNIAFQPISKGVKPPNGYQYVTCYVVLGIKIVDFQRKACLVVECLMIHTLDVITCSSVSMKEIVCIDSTMVALHDIEVKAADASNIYVMEPNREKTWTILDPEFVMIMVSLPS